jgi:hypothetical protein
MGGNCKNDVNTHFGKVGKICLAFKYMDALTIDDVFQCVCVFVMRKLCSLMGS